MLATLYKRMNNSRKYSYNYEELINSFDAFNDQFLLLENLKVGDKIGFTMNNKLYIDENNYYQGLSRWYYNQTRENVFDKFSKMVKEYLLYLRFVDDVHTNTQSIQYMHIVRGIIFRISKLSSILITALEFLKITYRDDTTIPTLLNTLCIDIKEKTTLLEDYNV